MTLITNEKASDITPASSTLEATPAAFNVQPEKPLVVIEPRSTIGSLGLRDIWIYRELLYFLSWRDIKVRYKQTALGIAWAILQPLLTMIIFTIFFGKFAGVPSDNVPYPLFAYAGLLPWTFLSNGVTNSGNSLVGSSHLITKVYFPRMIVPASAITAGFCHPGRADDLLWHRSDLEPVDAAAPRAADDSASPRCGDVAVGAECEVP
jgi:hypothetical protein